MLHRARRRHSARAQELPPDLPHALLGAVEARLRHVADSSDRRGVLGAEDEATVGWALATLTDCCAAAPERVNVQVNCFN